MQRLAHAASGGMAAVAVPWISVETTGTHKNEESMSFSSSPRVNLSFWTKKAVAGARSSTVRWKWGGNGGRPAGESSIPDEAVV